MPKSVNVEGAWEGRYHVLAPESESARLGLVMVERLLEDCSASELLKKFGAGGHKPGSGSAAALQGLLAAQLIRTVIELTNKPKRQKQYAAHLPRLLEIKGRVENHSYVDLETLLHKDAVQFGKAISLRKARDAETDLKAKKALAAEALRELKTATEIPILIANHCLELAGHALFVFDHGFASVRGDSGVALHAAISGVAGCISIIDLNLLSFGDDHWTANIRAQLAVIRNSLGTLYAEARTREDQLGRESTRKGRFSGEIGEISQVLKGKKRLRDGDIENLAIRLQRALYIYYDVYGKQSSPMSPKEILNPAKALGLIGFQVAEETSLGQHMVDGVISEVAGEINQESETVAISRQFEKPVRNFTTAHELGHALLHQQPVLHRDVPIDGSTRRPNPVEREADRFATHYLMPKKLLTRNFRNLFRAVPFRVTDDTAFALVRGPVAALRKNYPTKRKLSRFLASTDSYGDNRVQESLADFFGVSVEAMAIRLEELKLVEY